jgi:hypothetical protein
VEYDDEYDEDGDEDAEDTDNEMIWSMISTSHSTMRKLTKKNECRDITIYTVETEASLPSLVNNMLNDRVQDCRRFNRNNDSE